MPRRKAALGAIAAGALAAGSAYLWLQMAASDQALAWTLVAVVTLGVACYRVLWQRSEELRRGMEQERARLARDLHEDIGARLLNQVVSAPTAEHADAARATLGEVRALIDMLDARAFMLADCLVAWESRFAEQCGAAGIAAEVRLPQAVPDLELPPALRANPARIAAEFIDNAVRHAKPTCALLAVWIEEDELCLRLEHDGHRAPRSAWRPARGLRNLALRVADIRGRHEWNEAGERLVLLVRFPLPPDAP